MKGILALPLLLLAFASSSAFALDNIEMPVDGKCEESHMLIMDACVWKPYVSTRHLRDLQNEIKRFKAQVQPEQGAVEQAAGQQS